jgi:hypothetical protein
LTTTTIKSTNVPKTTSIITPTTLTTTTTEITTNPKNIKEEEMDVTINATSDEKVNKIDLRSTIKEEQKMPEMPRQEKMVLFDGELLPE